MQTRTRAAQWLDRLLSGGILFFLSFLWFATRTGVLLTAALLAAALTGLAAYAVFLWHRRRTAMRRRRDQSDRQQRAAVYALTMQPRATALGYAAQALSEAYALRRDGSMGELRFLRDGKGRRIAMGLYQSPQPADVREVHDFHRARRALAGVLVCAGGASEAAQDYARSLEPPLRLLSAGELPLPHALYESTEARQAQKQRKAMPVWERALRPAQALRCMTLGFLLLLAYLLTGRLTCLVPALALVFLALVCKGRTADDDALFGPTSDQS